MGRRLHGKRLRIDLGWMSHAEGETVFADRGLHSDRDILYKVPTATLL